MDFARSSPDPFPPASYPPNILQGEEVAINFKRSLCFPKVEGTRCNSQSSESVPGRDLQPDGPNGQGLEVMSRSDSRRRAGTSTRVTSGRRGTGRKRRGPEIVCACDESGEQKEGSVDRERLTLNETAEQSG